MTALVEMEQFVDTCSDIFMTRLGEFADSKTSFDLGHWLQCYAVFNALNLTDLVRRRRGNHLCQTIWISRQRGGFKPFDEGY